MQKAGGWFDCREWCQIVTLPFEEENWLVTLPGSD
jgi:hypothetical protein